MNAPFRKVVCVGLDGATFDVIDPLIKRGKLPALARLLDSGTRANLASTVPPLSAPAWVSFMTGMNPGKHGIFHFRAMESGALGASLVGSWSFRGRTIFDHASAAGLKVTSFRVPMTYPPWPVNGLMLSGFPTPDPKTNFCEPKEAGQQIGSLFKHGVARGLAPSVEDQIANFTFYLDRSTEELVKILNTSDTDLFCYVNSVTDWIAHKFWRFSDPLAPGYEPYGDVNLLEQFYEKTDASLGAILDAASPNALVIVLSDHGTGPRTQARVSTAAWLKELGLLVPASGAGGRNQASKLVHLAKDLLPKKYWIWQHTPSAIRKRVGSLMAEAESYDHRASTAYAVPIDHHVEGVNVNLSSRREDGQVSDGDYEQIRDQIINAAGSLKSPPTGLPVLEGAYRREEIYSGEHVELAPDVILLLKPDYEFGSSPGGGIFGEVSVNRVKRSSATHRPDGILALAGPGVVGGQDLGRANLIDVPATILWALGLEVPAEMDGEVLLDGFDPDLVKAHPVRRSTEQGETSGPTGTYSPEEEELLAAHLSDLGYL